MNNAFKIVRASVGHESQSFVVGLRIFVTAVAKPFINKNNSYTGMVKYKSDRDKLAHDFEIIGKDMYRSLDKYLESRPSR